MPEQVAAPVAVGPFKFPPDADNFRVAVLLGLGRVASSHPAVLAALKITPGDLVVSWEGSGRPAVDPAYGLYVSEPIIAMLARIGYAEPGDRAQAEMALSAAALLLLAWSNPEARGRERVEDSIRKGGLSVRRWWESKAGGSDELPRLLAMFLPQRDLGRDHILPVARCLTALGIEHHRVCNFERVLAYLQPEPNRSPRGPGNGEPDGATTAAKPRKESKAEDDTHVHIEAKVEAEPGCEAPGEALTAPDAESREAQADGLAQDDPGQILSLPAQGERTVPTGEVVSGALMIQGPRRYSHGLPDRPTRELDVIRIIRGEPSAAARRARNALDHVLPHARSGDLHAADWAYLKRWGGKATRHQLAITLSLIYGGQGPEVLPDWGISPDIGGCAADPDRCWLVLSPFGLLVPNRVNPRLPAGSGADPASTHVFLPFPAPPAGQPPHRLERLRRVAAERIGRALCDVEELEAFARQFDADAKQAGSAMRVSRLPRVLERVLYNQTGSGLVWQYVRNRDPEPVFLPALHYMRYELAEIADAYVKACSAIDVLLGGVEAGTRPLDLPLEGSVGSRFCPSDDQVKALLVPARELSLPRGAPQPETLAAFHNAMTRHSFTLLMTASGARPSEGGLHSLRPLLIESAEQTLWLINDKPQLGSGGRVLCLPTAASLQCRMYEKHRAWILEHRSFRSALAAWKSSGNDDLPWWFLFGEDGLIKPLTTAQWAAWVAPLKDNAPRHWVLNALRRMGWSADRIAVFAGHSGRVHNPTGSWSALPAWTREEQADLDRMLAGIGLVPRRGKGNG